MNNTSDKPATWFWIVCALSVLWNLGGLMAFFMEMTAGPETYQAMPPEERELYTNTPSWIMVVYGIAIFGSLLGNILLLMRKRLATPVLFVSFAAILVQMLHAIFLTKAIEVMGPVAVALPVSIIVIGGLMVWFAWKVEARGWIA